MRGTYIRHSPGMFREDHSDETGLRSSQENSPQVRVNGNKYCYS